MPGSGRHPLWFWGEARVSCDRADVQLAPQQVSHEFPGSGITSKCLNWARSPHSTPK